MLERYKFKYNNWNGIWIILVFVLVFLGNNFVLAAETTNPPKERPTIRVGYFGYDNFIAIQYDGQPYGYSVEFLGDIARFTKWDYEYVYGSWDQLLNMLAKGEIDLLTSPQRTPERELLYEFSHFEAGKESTLLCVLAGKEDIYYEDYQKFQGMRVGLIYGSRQNELFANYEQKHGFKTHAVFFDTPEAQMAALKNGVVDAVVVGSLFNLDDEKVVAKFAPEPFYFMAKKGDKGLVDSIDEACADLLIESPQYVEILMRKYYGNTPAFRPGFTRREMEIVQAQPVLTVVCTKDWAPIEYWDGSQKAVRGIAIDLMEEISRVTGLKFHYVVADSYAKAVEMLQTGEADLISCASPLVINGDDNSIRLSKSFLTVPMSFLVLKSPSFVGGAVGINQDRVGGYKRLQKDYPSMGIIRYHSFDEAVAALRTGQVSYMLDNTYMLEKFIQEPGNENMQLLPYGVSTLEYSVGLSYNRDSRLMDIINKSLTHIDSNTRSEIIIKNVAAAPSRIGFSTLVRQYLPQIVCIVALVLLAFLAYILYADRRKKKELMQIAYYDPLTNAYNLAGFQHYALEAMKHNQIYVVAQLDINRFKVINTGFGFKEGDRLLCLIAEHLKHCLGSKEYFAHEANDLFLLLLKDCGDEELCKRFYKLEMEINKKINEGMIRYHISLAVGICRPISYNETFTDIMGFAELARREAKKLEMNNIIFYENHLREALLRESEIENRMEEALVRGEFIIYYQPKYDLRNNQLVGAEALVRWQAGERLILPGEFIDIFERNGFIIKLDLYVFEQVCLKMRQWINEGRQLVPISVNVSRMHLLDPGFVLQYAKLIEDYHLPAELIELELTEDLPLEDEDAMLKILHNLKKLGVRLAMDDFGSGYSSLNFLQNMPFDVLKLDRLFFYDKTGSDKGRNIIASVILMANRLGLDVIAEGVETQEQADFLLAIGCNYVQGYYFSKPIPVKDFEEKLQFN